MSKFKYTRVVSPAGKSRVCFLNEPSQPYDGKGSPQYKTRVLFEDTPENRKWCDDMFAAGIAEGKKAGVKLKKAAQSPFHFPEDNDEEDFVPDVAAGKDRPKLDELYRDHIYFETKSNFKPGLIDAARQPLPDDVKIYNDDTIRAKIEFNPYEGFGSGLSLRMVTVQLIEKNNSFSGGAGSLDDDGFDEVEGGYVAPPPSAGGGDLEDDEIPF
jgi:hypothetical protein